MTLSLYIARRFALTFAGVFAVFFAILYLVDLIDQVRRYGAGGEGFGASARLALLHTPGLIYNILPLLMILAAIALFMQLARSSELVAIRAAGRSALGTLVAPLITALAIGVVAVAIFDPLVAATTKRYALLVGDLGGTDDSSASFGGDGLWLRQGDADGQWVIHAAKATPDGAGLTGVSFIRFGRTGGPVARIEAAQARLTNGSWVATDAKEWRFDTASNPEAEAELHDSISVGTNLTADEIRNSFGAPATVSIWDLGDYIENLDRAGFSSRKYAVWMQMEFALPLMMAAMVLVGAGFTMRHARLGRSGLMVLVALAAGLGIFFLRNFAQVLGESGQIPILLAAWSPPVAAALLSVSLLLHLEDG